MSLLEELAGYGVDVDEGVDRMMGDSDLYQNMLLKLSEMIEDVSANPDFDSSDFSGLAEKIHALKGAAGNLSVLPLYQAYTRILELLRADKPEQAKALYEENLPVQDQFMACIHKYMQDPHAE